MSASSTVGVDKDGNLYGDEVGPKDLKKYLKKWRLPGPRLQRCIAASRRYPMPESFNKKPLSGGK